MKSVTATITSKGQVTLPAEVRKHLGVGQGSRIAFVLEEDGRVRIEVPKYPNVASLRGAAGSLPRPLSWAEVQATIRDERTSRFSAHSEQTGPDSNQQAVEGSEDGC